METNVQHSVKEASTAQRMYDLEYQIASSNKWRPATSFGNWEAEAISEFAINYAPCMGTVVAVRISAPEQDTK